MQCDIPDYIVICVITHFKEPLELSRRRGTRARLTLCLAACPASATTFLAFMKSHWSHVSDYGVLTAVTVATNT